MIKACKLRSIYSKIIMNNNKFKNPLSIAFIFKLYTNLNKEQLAFLCVF